MTASNKRAGKAVPEGFTLPWNTTVTMADVWRVSLDGAARRKAERAELWRQADEAAALSRRIDRPKITPSGKIAYAGCDR